MKSIATSLLAPLLVFILLFFHFESLAKKKKGRLPMAVLVQLRVERNREKALTEHYQTAKLQILKDDTRKTNQAMINDYKDNFTLCPVYFYLDMNYDAVKAGRLDGVLLDADGNTVKKTVIPKDSTNYIIVHWGRPTMQSVFESRVRDTTAYGYNSGLPGGEGLIINDYTMHQLSYFYKFEFDEGEKGTTRRKYQYHSKEFNIQYYPSAKLLQTKLLKNPGHIRITKLMRSYRKQDRF